MEDNRKEDRYWTVEDIRPYIINELKKRFPDSIIEREFDNVDIMVHGPDIPVEIQKTYSSGRSTNVSEFEDRTRRQSVINIETYGTCWLFMDSKLLYHIQSNLTKRMSIDMMWMYQFWKDGKLRVFTISACGDITELSDHKDFEFIRRLSSTCTLSKDEEHRILNRNKSKITYKILKGHGFTTEECIDWRDEYDKNSEHLQFTSWLKKRGGRQKELGDIQQAVNSIAVINDMLKCHSNNYAAYMASILRIIEGIVPGNNNKYSRIRCSDNNNILENIPGYFEKKELWDYWRTHTVDHRTFLKVVRGEYPNYLRDIKTQKSIENAWD